MTDYHTDRSHVRFGRDPLVLDDATADRLVQGLDAADAPPCYGAAADLLQALRSTPRASELAGEESVLVAMAAGVAIAETPEPTRRTPMLKKFLSTRFAAAAAIGVLSMGGVAAAASGSVQTALASAISPLADVVTGSGSTTSTTVADTTSTTVAGTNTTDTTVADSTSTTVGDSTSSTGTPALTAQQQACANATNHGEYVSSVAHDSTVSGADHGKAVSEAAHSDCGKSATSTTDGPSDGTTATSTGTTGDTTDSTDAEQPDTQDSAKTANSSTTTSGKAHGGGKSGQHGKK